MRIIYMLLGVLMLLSIEARAQILTIHRDDPTLDEHIEISSIDSITIGKCDSALYDLEGCDIDIDSVDMNIQCGSVSLVAHLDGVPSFIQWKIYDINGNVVFMTTGVANIIFALPSPGSYYGTLEVSCGGGDEFGGDQDEDAFEIDYNLPTVQFDLVAHTRAVGTGFVLDLTPDNLSHASAPTFMWRVIDSVTNNPVDSSAQANPTFTNLDPSRSYTVTLDVTDDKGCTGSYSAARSADSCSAKFVWEYSWCQDLPGADPVTVQFYNQSDANPPAGGTIQYQWDFGDGSPIDNNENPSHTYACPASPMTFKVHLQIIIKDANGITVCEEETKNKIRLEYWDPKLDINVCCDGRVVFCTDADKGVWQTPGDMNLCNMSTCKRINMLIPGRDCGLQSNVNFGCGQTYWRYYEFPGNYTVTLEAARSKNFCVKRKEFKIDSVKCFNRNAPTQVQTILLDGYTFKMKFKVVQWPFMHKIIAKIKCREWRKMPEIRAEFAGDIYKLGTDGCFCSKTAVAMNPGNQINKRKAKAKLNSLGRFRVGMNELTATYYVKTPNNQTGTWTLQLGKTPCDRPCILWY